MTRAMRPPMRPSAAAAASRGRVRFGNDSPAPVQQRPGAPDFEQIQHSVEFVALRRRVRRFVFAASVIFFLWYLTYVLLSAYDRAFMSQKVFGQINVGIALGLLQFVSTVAITMLYTRFAKKHVDPDIDLIREKAGVGKA
jgi:uncharacterized membrane protein (DUF485 family)